MGQRILFLDDSPFRCRWARREFAVGNTLAVAATADEAVGMLGSGPPFDAAYLDHDLEGEHQDSSEPNTGAAVVRWIVANRPTIGRVVVHSLNAPAANRMVDDLRAAGYEAEYVNFLRLCGAL